MILHPVLHTLPEQQQIDLLTYYANNIIGEGSQMPNKVFKYILLNSPNAVLAHKLEDHMLCSDRVIDCYLDVIEKGIQHCLGQQESDMASTPQHYRWYEKDLETIATCHRLSPEHIKRIGCLLDYVADLASMKSISAAMYENCFSALAVNPMVDANTLKPQLEKLTNRLQRQQPYVQDHWILSSVVDALLAKRSDDAEIISLLKLMGREGKVFFARLKNPPIAVLNAFSLMEGAVVKIKIPCKPDNEIAGEQLVKAIKMFNFHPCNKEMETSIENNLSINTDNAINDFQYLLQLFNASAIRLKQFDAANGSGGLIDADREIMRRSGRLLINLMESGSISEGHIQSAAQAMLETKSGTKDADTGLEQYSLVGMVDWIKKHGFIDSEFIINTINDGKVNVNHYRLLEENPAISIADMELIVSEVYSKLIRDSELQSTQDINVFTQRRQFLCATAPMLLTAKYYPALLANEPLDANDIARAFEMGIYCSAFDEVDIKLMARFGMNDIYKAINKNIMEKIEKNVAIHELVTGLLLQERLEQAESSPTLVNKKRLSF